MKLMARLRRDRGNLLGNFRAYERELAQPDHKCVTILISRALSDGSDAICFGYQPETVNDPGYFDWLAQREEVFPDTDEPIPSGRQEALEQVSSMQQRDQPGIPISFRINGQLRFFAFHPFNLYGMLMKAIQFRPVALGASPNNPQPLRYIYLPQAEAMGNRRFTEVDFEFRTDNSFWVYLRAVRQVGPEVRVSDTMF